MAQRSRAAEAMHSPGAALPLGTAWARVARVARQSAPGALVRARATYAWLALPLAIGGGVRIAVFAVGVLGAHLVSQARPLSPLLIWNQWDATHYTRIAAYGYTYAPHTGSQVDFFPLLPLTIWLVQHATGLVTDGMSSYVLAGMIVSWTAFLAACAVLYRLTCDRFGPSTAFGAVALLAVFPFSFYYGAPFTEAVYLLLAVVAFFGVEKRRWWLAAGAALAAGAVRPPGIVVGACVVLAYALDWLRTRHALRWDVLALVLPPLGTAAYFLYCWVRFGDPLAYVDASQSGWHGSHVQTGGLLMAWDALIHLPSWWGSGNFHHQLYAIYAVLLVLVLVAVVPVARLLGAPYALFTLASVLLPVLTFPSVNSLGRYASTAFPGFILLGYALRRQRLPRTLVVFGSACCLGLLTVLFVLAFPMA